ncbi:MAG: serine/threonine protein kinase [Myxococcaceae bacterium]|nr:MAG: serine/threonine protein kinase [Myxococcaceae bacterium]
MKSHPPSQPESGRTPASRSSSSAKDALLGTQLGEYVLQERIGSGGMGVVYRAAHPLIGKQVAIKVLRAEIVSPEQEQRLLVEARAVNAIQHPGIIDIFGFGSLPDGRPYVVMELLKGQPLSDVMRQQGRLDINRVVWILDQMLAALGAAHKSGVVHRDLKPANVFLVETPDAAPSLKLVDFGIAKLLESKEGPTTADGSILGTPEYMAPEQVLGKAVGPATDLYAVGLMAFQMLTGTRVFQGEQFQVMFAHVEKPPPLPSSRAPGIPPEFDTLVLQLLAKEPALRPTSAEAVRQQLRRVSQTAPPGPTREQRRPRATTRREETVTFAEPELLTTASTLASPAPRRSTPLVGVVLVATVVCGAVWWMSQGQDTAPPPMAKAPILPSVKEQALEAAVPIPDVAPVSPPPGVTPSPPVVEEFAPPTTPLEARLKAERGHKSPSRRSSVKAEPPAPEGTRTVMTKPPAPEETRTVLTQPPAEKKLLVQKKSLEQRIEDIVVRFQHQNGVGGLDKDLREELSQIQQSARANMSERERGYLGEALGLWEQRLTRRMANRPGATAGTPPSH